MAKPKGDSETKESIFRESPQQSGVKFTRMHFFWSRLTNYRLNYCVTDVMNICHA